MPVGEHLISPRHNGKPLVDFVRETLGVSGRQAKALIDSRTVFVNDRRVWMARHRLATGDRIRIAQAAAAATRHDTLRVLLRTPAFIVVDKPAGMLSEGPASVESLLRDQLGTPALRIVHRLDKDTTGCLLAAMSPAARDHLVAQFRERDVMKLYHAIVHGHITAPERRITQDVDGQPAVSLLRVLDRGRQATHVRVRIGTGRTHQIRIHLAGIHHPVLGDRQYARERAEAEARLAIPRQMLHAAKLQFHDPDGGQVVRAEAPLPPDFKACLRSLRMT